MNHAQHNGEQESVRGKEIMLSAQFAGQQDFDEDLQILGILSTRVFRRAVQQDALLAEPEHTIEEELIEIFGEEELLEMRSDLDAAERRETTVDEMLIQWMEELITRETSLG